MSISVQHHSTNITRILQIIYLSLFIFSIFLMTFIIWFELFSFPMRHFNNHNHRSKRTPSSILNISNNDNDVSLKNYFAKRHCIKYRGNQQPFRFNEQPGQIDISGKLRIIVSINALNSLTNRYKGNTYQSFSLYFLISCAVIYVIICITLLSKILIYLTIMTFGFRNIIGIHRLHTGQENYSSPLLFKTYAQWSKWQRKAFDYLIWCHLAHALDFSAALLCWLWIFPMTFPQANEWHFNWVSRVFLYNLACEFIIYSFWHWMTQSRMSPYPQGPLHEKKFNPINPYEDKNHHHLLREITFTTLGWLQSAFAQCVFMWLWASGRLPYYSDFWSRPFFSIFILLSVTYWREFHFYWVHRFMHPWWSVKNGLLQGDIGAFLYRHCHSLHHKSRNPGPWSGLSMHPIEHLVYYTCAYFPLLFACHPLHFLYAKFHADIAPIGGHDGHDDPAGGADFHYLHHAFFECNYGVPLIDFDRLFGTYKEYVKKPSASDKDQD